MTKATFDVSQFETVDTATAKIVNPRGEPLMYEGKQVKITVWGTGTPQNEAANRAYLAAIRARTADMFRGVHNAKEDDTLLEAERLAGCTASIENFPIEGGALALYKNKRLAYITKQVTKLLDNDANFMRGSSES